MTLKFDPAPIPTHDKHATYRASEKGHATRQRYRASEKGGATRQRYNTVRKDNGLQAYLTKPFVAWDGEGVNESDGSHTYVLLGSSDGVSLVNRAGIPTVTVFDTWLASKPGCINVIYGGGYDINMVLRDMPANKLRVLHEEGNAWWRNYWMEWRYGKSFYLRNVDTKQSFRLFDVLPFFQRSFVQACDEYLGNDWPYRDMVIAEKARRGVFTFNEITAITDYNNAELDNLVSLCGELRERLYKVGLRVTRWDGPGAIASALLKREGVKACIAPVPDPIAKAGRIAYAGGRFEILRKGHVIGPTYEYDLNSAYPSAMRNLPCLAHGEWSHVDAPDSIAPFGLYHYNLSGTFKAEDMSRPFPTFCRLPNGNVHFPPFVDGWYWSPEATLLSDSTPMEGWVYTPGCDCDPFGFIDGLYLKRAALKKAGDGAHVGIKLGLNSLYGKLAQQLGWRIRLDGGVQIPPYHCLEWAGYVTSHCRATVYRAAMQRPDDVIAFETDAVFMRVPLNLPLGSGLGEWQETRFTSLTYLKSGMYWATLENGTEIVRCRGMNPGTLTRTDAVEGFNNWQRMLREGVPCPPLQAEQTRFIGLPMALVIGLDKWRRWITSPREISLYLMGKRMDTFDKQTLSSKYGTDAWEETFPGVGGTDNISREYTVEWINPRDFTLLDGYDSLQDVRNSTSDTEWELLK